ncbi:MAG: ACP S-malonyltransferase [Draconibacterium sp.]|nr:ACP S-malonyltransferase [Draconibacterium sp.]
MQKKIAHLFPAFVLKYEKNESDILEKHGFDFHRVVSESSEILGIDLKGFDIVKNNFLDDELRNQLFSYIFSCAFSDILHKTGKIPNYISGFSMGIYAAFYHAKSIDFATGLMLISELFNEVKRVMKDNYYIMASVIGFKEDELKLLINDFKNVEAVVKNGDYSFVISGPEIELKHLLEILEKEGAIHLNQFNVKFPYHSKLLKIHKQNFSSIASKYTFNDPKIDVISMVNQNELKDANQLQNEISLNITTHLDFMKTMHIFDQMHVKEFIEVGAGVSLLKNSKFIEGDFTFKAISKGHII